MKKVIILALTIVFMGAVGIISATYGAKPFSTLTSITLKGDPYITSPDSKIGSDFSFIFVNGVVGDPTFKYTISLTENLRLADTPSSGEVAGGQWKRFKVRLAWQHGLLWVGTGNEKITVNGLRLEPMPGQGKIKMPHNYSFVIPVTVVCTKESAL